LERRSSIAGAGLKDPSQGGNAPPPAEMGGGVLKGQLRNSSLSRGGEFTARNVFRKDRRAVKSRADPRETGPPRLPSERRRSQGRKRTKILPRRRGGHPEKKKVAQLPIQGGTFWPKRWPTEDWGAVCILRRGGPSDPPREWLLEGNAEAAFHRARKKEVFK